MEGFGHKAEEVPEGIGVLHVRGGVALLRVDEVGELESIPDEEDGRVVTHHVPVAFLRVELDGEPTRIPRRVGESRLSCHGRPSPKHGRLLADFAQKRCLAEIRDVVGDFEVAMRTRAFGVNHSLRDALPVEMRILLEQVQVFEQCVPALTHCQTASNGSVPAKARGIYQLQLTRMNETHVSTEVTFWKMKERGGK